MEQPDYRELAFPCTEANGLNNGVSGMYLRDYFATEIFPVLYTNMMSSSSYARHVLNDPEWRVGLACDAYKMADAMLKARSR